MKTALISVWDKTNLVSLAKLLHENGWKIIASGGTAREIKEAGLPVTLISEITGEPEILNGRVKTLHPSIYAGILARDTPDDISILVSRGWDAIELVVVNLYPFSQVISTPGSTLEDAIENIDIGGVSLLRAAAKNYQQVTALFDPSSYPEDLSILENREFRKESASKVFSYTHSYDQSIFNYLGNNNESHKTINLSEMTANKLRYGENPHQEATFYTNLPNGNPFGSKLLQGKPISYNNLLDLDTAWGALQSFDEPAVVVVKHSSPCGIAIAPTPYKALKLAIQSDPVSAFGSVIACNREIDIKFINELGNLFVECIISPSFTEDAMKIFGKRKNLRILEAPSTNFPIEYDLRSVAGGYLKQSIDTGDPIDKTPWMVATNRHPTKKENKVLRFAWKVSQYVKSNAIVFASADKDSIFTTGIGGGQPNRLDCVKIAGERSGKRALNSVMASDAFFPFPDGVIAAINLGITCIIQPGGSIRDSEVVSAANKAGISMVMTGIRHFRH